MDMDVDLTTGDRGAITVQDVERALALIRDEPAQPQWVIARSVEEAMWFFFKWGGAIAVVQDED